MTNPPKFFIKNKPAKKPSGRDYSRMRFFTTEAEKNRRLDVEVWKPLFVNPSVYEVSDQGRLRSLCRTKRWKILRGNIDLYVRVCLKPPSGKRRYYKLHRLVAETFLGRCPVGLQVAHLNGNSLDNRAENLKYCTNKENHSHRRLHGTTMNGMSHPSARLSDADVEAIRTRYKPGNGTSLAKEYGVCPDTIYRIARREIRIRPTDKEYFELMRKVADESGSKRG